MVNSTSIGRAFVAFSAILLLVFGLERAGLFSDGKIFRTHRGELREIILSDGTTFTLNTESELSATIASDLRSARLLRGEAYADITADEQRPFVIYAGSGRIMASGSARVHLRLWQNDVLVGVAAGSVRLNQWHQASIPLGSGESVYYDKQGRMGKVQPYVAIDELAWRERKIVLRDVPLAQALQQLLRYHETSAVLEDPILKQTRVSGELPTDNLPNALSRLQQMGPYVIRIDETARVHITQKVE